MSVIEPIVGEAERPGHARFLASGEPADHTWTALAARARELAGGLRALGVAPGDRVACLLTNGPDAGLAVPAAWHCGAAAVSLPLPARGMDPAEYGRVLDAICRRVSSRLVLAERPYAASLAELDGLEAEVVAFEDVPRDRRAPDDLIGPGDLAFVQCSSGSTGPPKGCMLTLRAVAEQLAMLGHWLDLDTSDRVVSWLPMSHDMGLFGGFLASWAHGMSVLVGTPERFVGSPHTWLQDCAEWGATMSPVPPSVLPVVVRRAGRRPPARPIPMRACIVGGERVEWSALASVDAELGRFGMTLDVLKPAYGLAEATLAVSATPRGVPPAACSVDPGALLRGELRLAAPEAGGATAVTSSGVALRGVDVAIAPAGAAGDGASGADGVVGEVLVRSPSLAEGYLGDPEATAARFREGRLRTGDLGFLHGGELHVIGRSDDVITVAGRNVSAAAVEAQLSQTGWARPGACVLVDVAGGGGSRMVLLAEPGRDAPDLDDAARRLAARTMAVAGVRVDACLWVERGALPKTPSGKVQRFRCRELALDGNREPVLARVELGRRSGAWTGTGAR